MKNKFRLSFQDDNDTPHSYREEIEVTRDMWIFPRMEKM